MTASNFSIGDIVKLKSGGPDMTVKTVFTDGDLGTQWFAGKKLEYGRFPLGSLQNVPKVEE